MAGALCKPLEVMVARASRKPSRKPSWKRVGACLPIGELEGEPRDETGEARLAGKTKAEAPNELLRTIERAGGGEADAARTFTRARGASCPCGGGDNGLRSCTGEAGVADATSFLFLAPTSTTEGRPLLRRVLGDDPSKYRSFALEALAAAWLGDDARWFAPLAAIVGGALRPRGT